MDPDVDRTRVVSSSVGCVLGGLTVAGLYALYRATWEGWVLPAARADAWKGPTLLVTSALVVLVLYVIAVRTGARRMGDWIVIGYALPLVLAAALMIADEIFLMLRSRVPQNLGLKTTAVMPLGRSSRADHDRGDREHVARGG